MTPEAREALEALERNRKALGELNGELRRLGDELAASVAAREAIYGIKLRPRGAIGAAVKEELDRAREVLAARRGAP